MSIKRSELYTIQYKYEITKSVYTLFFKIHSELFGYDMTVFVTGTKLTQPYHYTGNTEPYVNAKSINRDKKIDRFLSAGVVQ